MPYKYYVARRMGAKLKIVEKQVTAGETGAKKKGHNKANSRKKGVEMMMKQLFRGTTRKQLAKEAGVSGDTAGKYLSRADEAGVRSIARDLFVNEFLPEAMVVLQEALRGEDLKLATQVALKVIAGLQITDDPNKNTAPQPQIGEPESLEAWRIKFKKPAEAAVPQLPPMELNDLGESPGHEPHKIGNVSDDYNPPPEAEQTIKDYEERYQGARVDDMVEMEKEDLEDES